MQTTKTTSRNAALDYLLSIGNLIALADHKEEQIMNLLEEHDNVPTLPDIEPDEIKALQESIRLEIVQTSKERDELYKLRKELQRNFFDTYNIDQDYWCQFKHYAVALISAEECRNAHTSFQLDTVVTKLRKLVYQFLGIAMGVGPANCGRCLADAVEEKIQSKGKLTLPELPDEYKGPFKCLHDDCTWWIRTYKVMNPTQQDLGNWLQVEQIGESDWVCCKDLKPSTIQITLDEAIPIDADILKPTPIKAAWVNKLSTNNFCYSLKGMIDILEDYCKGYSKEDKNYYYESNPEGNIVTLWVRGIDSEYILKHFDVTSNITALKEGFDDEYDIVITDFTELDISHN